MDAEAIVWLVFIAIWFISGVVRQIKQVATQRPGQEGQSQPQDQPQSQRDMRSEPDRRRLDRPERPERSVPDDDPMVELLRKLGGEFEVRPQEPPRESRSEPVRAQSPPKPPPPTPKPQPSAAIDRSRPAAKVARQRGPVEPSLGAEIGRRPLPSVRQSLSSGGGRPSALARGLNRDLRRPDSLRKAILLKEILGKPPGLEGLKG